jgi:hypothetical protein
MLQLSWFFDFHSHKAVSIGARLEADAVAGQLADHGVQEVTYHAKCHVGYSYYPTRVATPHPRLHGDPFGALVDASKSRGLAVFAYVSLGIDGVAGRLHPEWLKHFADGPHRWDDWFAYVCPFTAYTDELLLPQVEEILERYPVDGVWFDTMSALNPCYCATCRSAFREMTGHEPPREPGDPHWDLFGQFRFKRGQAVLERIGTFIAERRRGAMVAFNQVGSAPLPDRPPRGITRISLDYSTRGTQSRRASSCAAFGSTVPYKAEVIPTLFNGGWGDWSLAPAQRQEQIAAAVWARRCVLNMGDRLHPDARLTPITPIALGQIARCRQAMAALMPPDLARRVADVIVLHAETGHNGVDRRHFTMDLGRRMAPLHGMCDLLLDAGANFDVSPEYALAEHLAHASLVVLPQTQAISESTDALLRRFAQRGGQVLVVGTRLPLVRGAAMDWFGVNQAGGPWLDHVYLPSLADEPEDLPVLVRGDHHVTRATSAEVIGRAIPPVDVIHGERFGWGIGPASEKPADSAIFTCQTVGQGGAWLLAAPLASDYHAMGNWQQAIHMVRLLRRIQPRPAVHVDSPYGCVEVVAYADEQTLWAVLVNHGGEQRSGSDDWPRTWGPLPPHEVTLHLTDAAGRVARSVSLNGQPVPVQSGAGACSVRVRLDRAWSVVSVTWSPSPRLAPSVGPGPEDFR